MISMPALMDRQRFQIRRDGARLGLVCGEIENQFRSALEQATQSVVNTLTGRDPGYGSRRSSGRPVRMHGAL